jgi:exodeoxyribonuclease V beta subunit
MPYTSIKSYEDIDITKHAIIEASAGTGKTYTIENLVIRFLNERDDLNLENILLVTFTEKATCELKIRIREKLESQLDEISDPANTEKIKNTLDAFDSASIYTIHGFCRSILRDYAFENNAPFQWELIDDYPLFERLLKEQIRKTWPAEFGDDLYDILIISDFPRKKVKFESSVISGARFFRQNSKDQVYPDLGELNYPDIVKKVREIRKLVIGLNNLCVQTSFCKGFEELNGQKAQKKILSEKIVTPLGNILEKIDSDHVPLFPLIEIIFFIEEKGLEYLQIKYLKKGGANPEICPQWVTVCQHLEKVYELYLAVKDALQAKAIFQLQKDVQAEKLKHGWISFDDMLSHVQTAVCSPQGSPLVDILRKKYRVAFVDEFQDTDPVQWQIFKKIFISEPQNEAQNLLFLIGDPKQAIYAFRGADVYAYLDARKEMERLENEGSAVCYCLSTNWRSEPGLISLYNELFCTPEWFTPVDKCRDFEIAYLPVQAPEENKRICSIKNDLSTRGFLNIIDLSEAPSLKASKPLLAKFIAEEIQHLLHSEIVCYNGKNQECFPLSYGDFCVLVRGKSDIPFLEEQFNRLNIPYSYYKKPGLFLSSEAFYLSLVLHAIDEPSNVTGFHKALLTPFFNFAPEDLYFSEEISSGHPVKRLLYQWREWAFSRKWNILFQSLMEDSGLLFRESIKPCWERKHTNYCQILEHLQEKAYHQNLDFRGLTALLDGYRKGTSAVGEDADLHQIETEIRKVQIMTMHVAKGLEFPIVFVFGGLTQPANSGNDFYIYHKICGQPPRPIKIFDFSKTFFGKEECRTENESEDKRLYYVALTRARLKLYVPCYNFNRFYPWVGPVSKLLSPALIKAFGPDCNQNNNVQWFKGSSSIIGTLNSQQPEHLVESDAYTDQNSLIPTGGNFFPQQKKFSHRIIEMVSFSSLHHMTPEKKEPYNIISGFSTMPAKSKEDDESFASNQKSFLEESGGPNDIPGGTDTGSMFHDILENIPFDTVSEAVSKAGHKTHPLLMIPQTRELIESRMETYQIDRRWIFLICDIILNTLTTPVSNLSKTFVLSDLKKEDRLHEAEFYFSYPINFEKHIPEGHEREGFIRGFIDLIFRYEDKFYIADWKSNILENYDQVDMEKSIIQANYDLQYKIYTVAVLRWLNKKWCNNFDPLKNFGGVFFFYIRGMNGKNNNGIYYISPDTLGSLEGLEKYLLDGPNVPAMPELIRHPE